MAAVPAATPVTAPSNESAVAMPVLLLLQRPPVVALPSVNVKPAHSGVVPVTPAGRGFTVIVAVAAQPEGGV